MSNVNRTPAGALELLNLNLQGEFPRDLGSQLSPTLDMQAFYLDGIGLRSVRALSPGVTLIGDGIGVTIPNFETWAIRSVTLAALNQDAATQVSCSIIAYPGRNDGPEFTIQHGISITTLTNQIYRIGNTFPVPLLLSAGTTIQSLVNILGGAPVNGLGMYMDVFYYPLTLR